MTINRRMMFLEDVVAALDTRKLKPAELDALGKIFFRHARAMVDGLEPIEEGRVGRSVKRSDIGARVIEVVLEEMAVTEAEVRSSTRERKVTLARHIICHALRELAFYDLVEIGRFIGRDHTTVLHAIRRVRNILKGFEPSFYSTTKAVLDRVKEETTLLYTNNQ